MRILRRITGKPLGDRTRSYDITRTCNINNINTWDQDRKDEWKNVRSIARNNPPIGRSCTSRHIKKWAGADNQNKTQHQRKTNKMPIKIKKKNLNYSNNALK